MYGAAQGDEHERRYSPATRRGTRTQRVTGNPDPAHIATSYVERQNLNIRMQNRRFTRLTNAFSKKVANHAYQVALYTVFYNFCRIHKTLKMTPAMAAGITSELRDVDWIAGLVEARDSRPRPRGPYRRAGSGRSGRMRGSRAAASDRRARPTTAGQPAQAPSRSHVIFTRASAAGPGAAPLLDGAPAKHGRRSGAKILAAGSGSAPQPRRSRMSPKSPQKISRKIYFYRALTDLDEDGSPTPFDPTAALRHIDQLEFSAEGRYLDTGDTTLCCWVHRTGPPQQFRLGHIRRTGLPLVEERGRLADLQIPDDSGLVEVIHIVVFEDNIRSRGAGRGRRRGGADPQAREALPPRQSVGSTSVMQPCAWRATQTCGKRRRNSRSGVSEQIRASRQKSTSSATRWSRRSR